MENDVFKWMQLLNIVCTMCDHTFQFLHQIFYFKKIQASHFNDDWR
jgi:hypothetical protein